MNIMRQSFVAVTELLVDYGLLSATIAELRAADGDVSDDERKSSGTHRQPVDVVADGHNVEQHSLQGGADGELAYRRADDTLGNRHA